MWLDWPLDISLYILFLDAQSTFAGLAFSFFRRYLDLLCTFFVFFASENSVYFLKRRTYCYAVT
jgi:hypothetical protein